MNDRNYVLWLPSWYPNKKEPFNGDFIQRHARAVSLYESVTVISFPQFGSKVNTSHEIEEKISGKLKEIIVNLPFRPFHISVLDRIRYNLQYYLTARTYLEKYFEKFGLPALVHVHVPVKAGNLALWIKKKYNIPFIVSEQASTYMEAAPDNYFQRSFFYKLQLKEIFRKAACVTNVSGTIGLVLKKLFLIRDLHVIHNTVDTGMFCFAPQANKAFTYLHVSSLSEQKNIFGILRAFYALSTIRKDWKLVLVGPYSAQIKEFIQRKNLDQLIELTGEVSYQEVAKKMKASNAFVLFSRHENFPCVVVEALCCGLPVVSSDVAGVKEAINESNGILTAYDNEDMFLAGLLKMRETHHLYNSEQISAAAIARYNFQAIGAQFHNVYTKTKTSSGIDGY
ncbi:MAG: glycosyltransferase family 4 protein [Chitinophagaceae bacterium]|nr:MAG: glycosyltransferase family 4 protein [Chitinophagaceae bacterium]